MASKLLTNDAMTYNGFHQLFTTKSAFWRILIFKLVTVALEKDNQMSETMIDDRNYRILTALLIVALLYTL